MTILRAGLALALSLSGAAALVAEPANDLSMGFLTTAATTNHVGANAILPGALAAADAAAHIGTGAKGHALTAHRTP